jgi:hypothetical protein
MQGLKCKTDTMSNARIHINTKQSFSFTGFNMLVRSRDNGLVEHLQVYVHNDFDEV